MVMRRETAGQRAEYSCTPDRGAVADAVVSLCKAAGVTTSDVHRIELDQTTIILHCYRRPLVYDPAADTALGYTLEFDWR